jgi:multidrug resistance protein MdtO
MTLATVLALVLLLVLQMPFAALGLYSLFLIGRESPSVSLRTGLASLMTVVLAIAVAWGLSHDRHGCRPDAE